jgi:uncharacterized membrane protein
MKKVLPIALLFFGESLAIYSEVVAAKNIHTFGPTFWKMSLVMALAGFGLVAGYMLGVKYLQNIWVIGLALGILGLASALFVK